MRLVLTTNFSPWSAYSGGGQRSTHELAAALAEAGHDVSVVYTRPPWESFPTPNTAYRIHWATFFDVKSRRAAPLRSLNALSVAQVVRELHRASPIHALHGNGEEVVLAARWARSRGIPVVTTPRYPDYPKAMLREDGPGTFELVRLWLSEPKYLVLRQAVRFSHACCPTSAYSAAQVAVALRADARKLIVVPNGVSAVFFEKRWAPSAQARPLLFFGRLERDKGLDVLLAALARGHAERRLLVVGRGDESASLRQQAAELGLAGRVEWREWLGPAELADTLANCAMAVLPSRHESFGNAMAEAMAIGAPLVSTRAGSIPELVQHEETGLLVEPNDPEALESAISRLEQQRELGKHLGRAGRERTQATYGWSIIAQRYLDIYQRLSNELRR